MVLGAQEKHSMKTGCGGMNAIVWKAIEKIQQNQNFFQ
jgi:hypothetical protein